MMKYIFKTRVYPKPYNEKIIWLLSDYVEDLELDANSDKDALAKYFEHLDSYGYEVSCNAKRKRNIGEGSIGDLPCDIYTAKTLICDRSANYCKYHYVDVFVSMRKII